MRGRVNEVDPGLRADGRRAEILRRQRNDPILQPAGAIGHTGNEQRLVHGTGNVYRAGTQVDPRTGLLDNHGLLSARRYIQARTRRTEADAREEALAVDDHVHWLTAVGRQGRIQHSDTRCWLIVAVAAAARQSQPADCAGREANCFDNPDS